jgi:hypothetical protein
MSNHLKAIAEELKSIAENHIKITHPKAAIKCHISSSDFLVTCHMFMFPPEGKQQPLRNAKIFINEREIHFLQKTYYNCDPDMLSALIRNLKVWIARLE